MPVLGVDACPEGWIGIRLEPSLAVSAFCASTIQELVGAAGRVDVIGIDIPIGLPTGAPRQAEALARKLVGPRASSVFTPPPRAVLEAPTHAEASAISRRLIGQGVTQQAYRLGPKILQVEDWLPRARRAGGRGPS